MPLEDSVGFDETWLASGRCCGRGWLGMAASAPDYLVRISLPLLVRRSRYSVLSCTSTASRPPPRRSDTGILGTAGPGLPPGRLRASASLVPVIGNPFLPGRTV